MRKAFLIGLALAAGGLAAAAADARPMTALALLAPAAASGTTTTGSGPQTPNSSAAGSSGSRTAPMGSPAGADPTATTPGLVAPAPAKTHPKRAKSGKHPR